MPRFNRFNRSKLVFALLVLGGCSQIIGLSDYDVDPSLDEPEAGGDSSGSGGKGNTGGKGNVIPGVGGEGGTAGVGQGGAGADGGMANEGGVSGDGAGGDAQGGVAGEGGEGGAGGAAGGGGGLVVVPCESANCCAVAGGEAVGEETLLDGSFELADTPWIEDSSGNFFVIVDEESYFPDFPRSPNGRFYAFLAGVTEETSSVQSEDVLIPSDAGWIEVSGIRLFEIDSHDTENYDYAYIGLFDAVTGDELEEPFYWTDPVLSPDGWGDVTPWTEFKASFSATPHQNEQRYLYIGAYSDAYPDGGPVSSYLFDSISLKVFRCYK